MRQVLVDRIDPQKAYEYFKRTQGWSKEMVDQQVLTPLDPTKIIGTEADRDSIMCYQLPGTITKDGKPIRGGLDINPLDADFTATIYPKIPRSGGRGDHDRRGRGAGTAHPDGDRLGPAGGRRRHGLIRTP